MAQPPAASTSGNTTNVALNVPILCVAIGVALAVAAEHLTSPPASSTPATNSFFGQFPHVASFAIVLITAAYALFELIRQGRMAWQQPALAPGICRSASFAAFLLGLISVAVSDTRSQSLLSTSLGIGLCVLALIGFLAITFLGPTEMVNQKPMHDPGQVGPYPADYFRPYSGSLPVTYDPDMSGVEAPPAQRKPRIDPSTLPPLFETDPLYSIPRPKVARSFSMVKGNDNPIASDDACVISDDETYFALCDGASGSSLPRPWATLLGQQWLKWPFQEIDAETLALWLQEPRERWHRWIQETWKWKIDERNQLIGEKPLSADVFRRTLQTGASSTFLGLLLNRENNSWHAAAIGDTCLFIFRGDRSGTLRPRFSFPLDSSAGFSDRPPLLTSNGNNVSTLAPYFRFKSGHWRRGDVLLMATDALAQWLLSQFEQQQTTWNILPSLTDPRRFAELVEKERQSGHMVDDDTTLVVIPL